LVAPIKETLPPDATGKPLEIWFQDEARVGQKGSLTYVWAERGSRPPMVRDCRHTAAYLFGAACPQRAVGAAIVMPSVNSEAMSEHLAEIARIVAPGAHAVLVCDGAGWHQSGERLTIPENISLLRLPPYAPELNPIENVWQYWRGNKLSRLVWESYDLRVLRHRLPYLRKAIAFLAACSVARIGAAYILGRGIATKAPNADNEGDGAEYTDIK
jgi:transposase